MLRKNSSAKNLSQIIIERNYLEGINQNTTANFILSGKTVSYHHKQQWPLPPLFSIAFEFLTTAIKKKIKQSVSKLGKKKLFLLT